MNRDIVKLLIAESKRKPDLALLITKGKNITDTDIEEYAAPLPWFRSALREYRARQYAADVKVTYGITADPEGEVAYWLNPEQFVQVNTKSSILVKTGDAIWRNGDEYWIDTVKCMTPPKEFLVLDFAAKITKSQYANVVQEVLRKRYEGITMPSLVPEVKSFFTIVR